MNNNHPSNQPPEDWQEFLKWRNNVIPDKCTEADLYHYWQSNIVNQSPPPTLQEQAQAYVNNDSTIVGPRDEAIKLAYLAGAQSTQAEVKELKEWKRQAMIVMPDMHEIGKVLQIKIGESVHDKILPGIQSLRSKLQVATDVLKDVAGRYGIGEMAHMLASDGLKKIQEKTITSITVTNQGPGHELKVSIDTEGSKGGGC